MKQGIIGLAAGLIMGVAGIWLFPDQTRPDQTRPDRCSGMETPVKQLACRVSEAAISLAPGTTKFSLYDTEYKIGKNFKHFAALKAMEYVQANVSSARYSFLKNKLKSKFQKPKDANDALERGIGICGSHIAVFLAIMEELGITARAIQFWYENEPGVRFSHIGAEVYYANDWHYLDVTWGAFFSNENGTKTLSIDEVMNDNKRVLHVNEMNVWYQQYRDRVGVEGVFSYLYKDADITKDYVGKVRAYRVTNTDGAYTLPLLHIPNYVGDNRADGEQAGMSYLFDVPEGKYQVKINLSGKGGCTETNLYINDEKVVFENNLASLVVDTPRTAETRGKDDVCYYVLKDIKMAVIN